MRKNKVIFLVVAVYILTLLMDRNLFGSAVENTSYFLIEMVQVMPVIFVLTVVIDVWIPRETITKSLGDTSGLKGSLLSFLFGSVSAGPIYAAFPITLMLFKKGASIKNVVIIISSWAVIKVPMLANEAKFLGTQFMMTRWFLTVIAIYIMSVIINTLIEKEDIIVNETKQLSVKLDRGRCIVCGQCVKKAPNHFSVEHNQLKVIADYQAASLSEAIKLCPVNAIKEET